MFYAEAVRKDTIGISSRWPASPGILYRIRLNFKTNMATF